MNLFKTLALMGALLGTLPSVAQTPTASPSFTTAKDVYGWMEKNRDWQRWGARDQLGTANLITASKRKEAARLVQEGVSVSLAHPVEMQPAFLGVPYLEPGTAIQAKDLDAWEKKTKVRVSSGDAVIVRMGRWARRAMNPALVRPLIDNRT